MGIQENSDPVAMTAQADIHRFFVRVIHPALVEFEPRRESLHNEAMNADILLDRAEAATHNALCYEMRRAFALTIGAMFERQLRSWLVSGAADKRQRIECANLPSLEAIIQELRGISLEAAGVAEDIHELWSVANAVRHGDGYSREKLDQQNPGLWDHPPDDVSGGSAKRSVGNMRVKGTDLWRYTMAVLRFWSAAGASSIPGP